MDAYDGFGLKGQLIYSHKDDTGKYHSFGGSPAVRLDSGINIWMKHGIVHNEDGPAITFQNGDELWIQGGYLHRNDGPALVTKNESKWYTSGKFKKRR